jgi:hypothetical protein
MAINMVNSVEELMKKLKISGYPDRWNLFNERLKESFVGYGGIYPGREYILELHEKYRLFDNTLDEVLDAAEKLKSFPELMQYILLLDLAMEDRESFKREIGALEVPSFSPGEDPAPYDFALLFTLLSKIPRIDSVLKERGVPTDIRFDTHTAYEECLKGYKRKTDRYGFDKRYFNWIQRYIDVTILRVGRLNIEMRSIFKGPVYVLENQKGERLMMMTGVRLHRDGMVLGIPGYEDDEGSFDASFVQTEEYFEGHLVGKNGRALKERTKLPVSDWRIVLSPEDPVLSVHIPAGEKLTPELCEESYKRSAEVISKCFPEFRFKAFVCFSWLMDPQLADMLPPDSNIVTFQNKYMRFPTYSSGRGAITFVFFDRYERLEDLPERTTLERSIKRHYLSGKYIYEPGGVFFI